MQCKTVLRLAEQHVPAMLQCVRQSVKQGKRDLDFLRLEETSWAEIEADSIDYALMEKAENLAVFPLLDAGLTWVTGRPLCESFQQMGAQIHKGIC